MLKSYFAPQCPARRALSARNDQIVIHTLVNRVVSLNYLRPKAQSAGQFWSVDGDSCP